jgi:hypothetical protein
VFINFALYTQVHCTVVGTVFFSASLPFLTLLAFIMFMIPRESSNDEGILNDDDDTSCEDVFCDGARQKVY